MALGKGIHTVYYDGIAWGNGEAVSKPLMEELFNTSPFAQGDLATKQKVTDLARKYMFGYDTKFIQGGSQLGPNKSRDVNPMFPHGVNLAFQGNPDDGITPPNIAEVKWTKTGDPANPYVPDIRSPGADPSGRVNVDPNDTAPNPEISVDTIKPAYVNTNNTRNPIDTGKQIHTAVAEERITLGAAFEGEWK